MSRHCCVICCPHCGSYQYCWTTSISKTHNVFTSGFLPDMHECSTEIFVLSNDPSFAPSGHASLPLWDLITNWSTYHCSKATSHLQTQNVAIPNFAPNLYGSCQRPKPCPLSFGLLSHYWSILLTQSMINPRLLASAELSNALQDLHLSGLEDVKPQQIYPPQTL